MAAWVYLYASNGVIKDGHDLFISLLHLFFSQFIDFGVSFRLHARDVLISVIIISAFCKVFLCKPITTICLIMSTDTKMLLTSSNTTLCLSEGIDAKIFL